nr:C1q-binding complement inhibitor VraX [Staphylococcus haemolyticus]
MIYKLNIENGISIYEIITKKLETITVKFYNTTINNGIYKFISVLINDLDNM